MQRCWAYQLIAGSKTAWVPCVREAAEGSNYCGRHGAAITGAMLGMLTRLEEDGDKRKGRGGSEQELPQSPRGPRRGRGGSD